MVLKAMAFAAIVYYSQKHRRFRLIIWNYEIYVTTQVKFSVKRKLTVSL